MERQHLNYFKIENFKCFEKFEINNLGQFNLIVGDNNIGKTTFLEILLFSENLSTTIGGLVYSHNTRNDSPISNNDSFDLRRNYFNYKSELSYIEFEYLYNNTRKKIKIYPKKNDELTKEELDKLKLNPFVLFEEMREKEQKLIDKQSIVQYKNETLDEIIPSGQAGGGYFPIIFSSTNYGSDLASFLSRKSKDDKTYIPRFINDLQYFIDGLEDISLNNDYYKDQTIVLLALRQSSKLMPLASQGQGAIKFCRVLLELSESKNYRLMIDEIDNGIHYTRLKKYLLTIIKVAKEQNVQLFATTHSSECLKCFKDALEELGVEYQQLAREIRLEKISNNQIKAYANDYEQMKYALENDIETRGGN